LIFVITSPPLMTDGAVRKGGKRPRPCGMIYQQSTSGMIPEGLGMLNKKTRSRREEIPRVKATAR
ncbi:hypothetical protein CQA02_27550, partial [Klebsiella variicola]